MQKKKFTLVAGGTGGHVFPMLALAKDLKEQGHEVFIITDKRGEKILEKDNMNYSTLPIKRLGFLFFLKAPYLFLLSLFWILSSKNVFFFGGYVSFYPFLAAMLLLKKRFIFQLDSHITRLNRFLIPFAHKVYYIFAQTNFRSSAWKKGKCVARYMPLRSGFKFSYIRHSKPFVITVIGGSLGSAYWKKLLEKTFEILKDKKQDIVLNIQTNENSSFFQAQKWQGFYEINIASFFDTANLFEKSHLIIARAGACTLAEISRTGRAAYLVPWIGAVENHQYINAKNYCEFQGAIFGNDPVQLAEYIKQLMDNEKFFYQTCKNASIATLPYKKFKL